MKIAHVAIVSPSRCGLYETTRELVAAERALGVDARIVDPKPIQELYPKDGHDRGVPLASMDWATGADVIASHSGHDRTPVAETKQPIVHVAHGRPLSTFLGERNGGAPVYSYHVTRSQQERYKACVTFWPEYAPILRQLWRAKPVHVVTAPVDAAWWRPGKTDYDFGGKAGGYNVIIADPWSRVDVSPLHAVHAFAAFRAFVPGAKLHIYAIEKNHKGIGALSAMLGGSLGVVHEWASDLLPVYRAADMLITPHRIATRAVRESMATGCQVVTGKDAHPEDPEAFALAMKRRRELPEQTERLAEVLFSPQRCARQFLQVARAAIACTIAGAPWSGISTELACRR